VSVGQLAIAWTLANSAVDVTIFGTRDASHVDEAVVAADIELGGDVLEQIDEIMRDAVPIAGPAPELMAD